MAKASAQNAVDVYRQHNHGRCISQALSDARDLCRQRKARLTPLRELVLELVWQSHEPLGAYPLMDLLRERYEGNVAPPTVYRALEFLRDNGLVHRLASLNAYIGCSHCQDGNHQPSFFICRECNRVMEIDTPRISQAIKKEADANNFLPADNAVEVMGVCVPCEKKATGGKRKK
jgi:Fur family zinc uptake transcriptional regulator